MKAMECPNCGGELDVYVDILNPIAAIAADMLERAVMYQCTSCFERSTDFSQVQCPKCFAKTLETALNRKQNIGINDPVGHIFCNSCDLKLVF